MTREEWELVGSVYLELAALDSGERASRLDLLFAGGKVAGRTDLRQELESLLAEDAAVGSFLDQGPVHLAQEAWEASEAGADLPSAIGPYRILRVLGQGGMGTVYLAEQDSPRRLVALKVIRAGFATDEVRRRFQLETEALGRLQHPGIARIYSAGITDAANGSQPYFAMEYVPGKPLLEYVAQLPVSAGTSSGREERSRVELFVKICDAVAHAHQQGIIHRDLKPNNILVDDSGQPKIVDFGVARLTDSDISATRQTDMGQLIGTLAYMSPEQALGDPSALDTRSDVYALGVILYQLLAGRLPYDINRFAIAEAVRVIREEDPTPLSGINRSFRGDIETIVGKALEKERARRYPTVGAMAEDLRRHMRNEPIVARRPSAAYRAKKFFQRNRILVLGTLAIILALTAGVVTTGVQAYRARQAEKLALDQKERANAAQKQALEQSAIAQRERNSALEQEGLAERERNEALTEKRRADESAAEAQALNSFLLRDLLAQADIQNQLSGDRPDPDIKVRTALDRAAASLTGRFTAQPLVEASVRRTLGESYAGLALIPAARKQFERELELRLRHQGPGHPDTIECRIRLGWLRIAEGKYAEAHGEALELEKLTARPGVVNEALRLEALHLLGTSYIKTGKFPTAIQLYSGMLETVRRGHAPDSPEVTRANSALAAAYEGDRQFSKGAELLEPLVKVLQARLGPEHPETLATRVRLAGDLTEMKQWDEARTTLSEIVAAYEHLRGPDHPETLAAMNSLAGVLRASHRAAEAMPIHRQVYERRLRTQGPDHPDTITALNNIAGTYTFLNESDKAIPLFQEVYAERKRVLGPDHTSTLVALMNIAVSYAKMKEWANAETYYRELWEICKTQKEPIFNNIISAMNGAQGMMYRQGKYAESEALEKEIIAYRQKVRGFAPEKILQEEVILADIYYHEKKFADAEQLLLVCLKKENAEKLPTMFFHLAESLEGGVLARQGKWEEARPLLEQGYRGLEAERSRTIELELFYIDEANARLLKKGFD